jgi:hypothetical protein
MKIRMLAAIVAAALAGAAHAAPVFSDNFDTDSQGLNVVPSGWTVTGGTVDIIPVGSSFHFVDDANGNYVDLDGSTGSAGLLSTTIATPANGQFTATFSLAGNHRDGSTELVTVNFGGTTETFSPSELDDLTVHTITGNAVGGSITLSFQDASHDNIGALLDDVSVSAVPEPGSLTLMAAGVLGLAFAARRRRG